MKKILILTVTAGNGHNACARAMKARLEADGDVTVEIVDLLKEFSSGMNFWLADTGYDLAVGKLLPVYNLFYNHYKKLDPAKRYSNASQSTCLTTVAGLLKKILDFRPDAIYCTHYDCAVALTDLKLVYPIPARIVAANLDYVYSPFWESTVGVDYLVIPNEEFIEEGLQKGFRREQLLPYGLPVRETPLCEETRQKIREQLGLQDRFTVLVMFGGGHWKGAYKIYKMVERTLAGKDAQIIMINGRDESSFRKVEKRKKRGVPVLNVGFTNDIPRYLAAADVVINKSGGTGVTEMLDAALPMLIYEKTPAQERYNLVYLKGRGVALSFGNEASLRENLLRLLEDGRLRAEMSENARRLARNATARTAELLESAPEADYSALEAMEIDFSKVHAAVRAAVRAANKRGK